MKNILLVEDDPFLVEIYNTKLKDSGFEVDTATDGEECLKKIGEKKPDIILLDIVLPNTNGWEILRKVGKDENLKTVKIIVLSNLSQKEEVDKGMQLGAVKFLIKSHFSPSEVVEEIKKIIA